MSGGASMHSSTADSRVIAALSLGNRTSSGGGLSVTGPGSSAVADGYVYVGRGGTGTLVVNQFGTFIGGSAATGSGTGASAAFGVTIGDGTPNLDVNGNPNSPLYFGGTGVAQVSNGSVLYSRDKLSVGSLGSTGFLLVDTSSQALADGQIVVGGGTDRGGGTGTVTVQGGSTLRSGGKHVAGVAGIVLGQDANTAGTLNVTGAVSGATTLGDRLAVGGAGTGRLNVSGGGTVVSGAQYGDAEAALTVAALAGGHGAVVITGAGSNLVADGLAVIGGDDSGAGVIAGGAGSISVSNGGTLSTGPMQIEAGSTLALDATSEVAINGNLIDSGQVVSFGALNVSGTLVGGGSLGLAGGLTTLAALAGTPVSFAANNATLRVSALSGATTVSGFQFGNSIDLAGTTGVTLNGNTVTTGTGSLILGSAPAGYAYQLYGDPAGGTEVLLNPASPSAGAFHYTDVATHVSGTSSGTAYTGPVSYLQEQYVWASADPVALSATVPNAFLHGGPGDDAIQAGGGSNVLDGGAGSNFLVGSGGADGGTDTFFIDGRGGGVTWSTIVNFHHGDQFTFFGFTQNQSTAQWVGSDGVAGYQGLTLHSALGGVGTGVDASATLTGLSMSDLQKLTITTGTVGGNNYLLVQYTGT